MERFAPERFPGAGGDLADAVAFRLPSRPEHFVTLDDGREQADAAAGVPDPDGDPPGGGMGSSS